MKFRAHKQVVLLWCVALAHLSSAPAFADTTNYSAPGNLAPTHILECLSPEQVKPQYTPADLSLVVYDCIAKNRYGDALFAYATLFAFGSFDGLRVSDISAPQGITVLNMQSVQKLKQNIPGKFKEFQAFARNVSIKTGSFVGENCRFLAKLGPPDYHPRYMIQHGIKAFTNPGDDGLKTGFNPSETWQKIVDKQLKCP